METDASAPRSAATNARPTILTPKEVAAELRIHKNTVRRLIREGQLPGMRIGATYRIHESTFRRWLEEQSQNGARPQKSRLATATGRGWRRQLGNLRLLDGVPTSVLPASRCDA
jgi:excisionase family DNA binding protein